MVNIVNKIKRSVKHGSRLPNVIQFKWLNKSNIDYLQEVIAKAEVGHSGEIQLVIERSLPVHLAWGLRIRERALDLFAHFRIWDTQDQSGVLVYVNLVERRLELVADRGIDECVAHEVWQAYCDQAIIGIREGQPIQALETLLNNIAKELREHYGHPEDPAGNELPNRVVIL